jgi:5,10-methenyltetrahydromethanopterin hydrogenase
MTTEVIEILGTEPITTPEAKQWLRVYHNNDDDLITTVLVPAVRSLFEGRLDVSLIEKKIRVVVENAEENFRLPQWPVDAIELIEPDTLIQTDGVLDNDEGEDIDVTYTTKAYVKPEIKAAMLNLISHWYITRDLASIPDAVEKVIKQNTRILWFV